MNIQSNVSLDTTDLLKNGAWGIERRAHADSEMVRFYMLWRSPVHLELIEATRDIDPKAIQIKAEHVATKGTHLVLAAPMPPQIASVVVWRDWAGEEIFDSIMEILMKERDD